MRTRTLARRVPRAMRGLIVAILLCVSVAGAYYLCDLITFVLAVHGYVGDETRYASGYSQARFDRIQLGWTKKQVEALLGRPLVKRDLVGLEGGASGCTRALWKYSLKGPLGGHLRRVYFQGDRVVRTEARWEPG